MNNVTEEMNHLHKLAKRDPDKRFNQLWESLTNPRWLAQAWEQIRNNRGSQTAGIDGLNAVDVDLPMIAKWATELSNGTYQPTPVRRCYLDKGNGKKRPLGIPTVKDRTIQQGLKMLLEPIFEADFKFCSHGFRPGRSTHTALRDVVRGYSSASWIIEGDIQGCFDNIPHNGLLKAIARRISDGKILHLLKQFLKAGYLEDWRFHRTYSGTAQGGILSPLLANVFLHYLDEFVEQDLGGNQPQSLPQRTARLNPEYQKVAGKLYRLRKKLKKVAAEQRRELVTQIKQVQKQLKRTPVYDKEKRHPCKIKYVRYADDFLVLMAGTKTEAEAIKDKLGQHLAALGLTLSEEKTKLTHWRRAVPFLGYTIQGKPRRKGIGIRGVLRIPPEKARRIRQSIERVCNYHHIPEADALVEVSALFRGWCNYYRYAQSPQPCFSKVAQQTWWAFAHYLARKTKSSSIRKLIVREKKAGRLATEKKNGRTRLTFRVQAGKRVLVLDIFPPRTEKIITLPTTQQWQADLKPFKPLIWQSGRSFATRLEARDRAQGVCERCHTNLVQSIHHTVPMKGRSMLARTMSDRSQQYTAQALCQECHVEAHGGSFRRRNSNGNAGYIERCSPSVGSAEQKPAFERK